MKIKSIVRFIVVAMTAFSFGLGTQAANSSSTPSHGDKSFLEKAAKSGMEELAVSQAALPHLTNPQVQQFAHMMVSDHSGANQELTALAASKGVALPAKQPDVAKWEKKKEKGYDEDYIEKMIEDHNDAVDLFTKASKKSDDPEIQAFAAKILPTLQAHQTQAKALKKALK